jgi:DNA repair protein RadC
MPPLNDPHRYQFVFTLEDAFRVFTGLRDQPREMAAVAFLSPERRLLGFRHLAGLDSNVTIPVRAIVRDALVMDATLAILAHNHPAGDSTPSADDLHATQLLARGLEAVGVTLLDHLVIAQNGTTSFVALGYL